jgi:YidC/Oxa1 family membrane protein insertase
MEKRAILAALLMAGLLVVYQFLFIKPPPSQEGPPAAARKDTAAQPGAVPAPVAGPAVPRVEVSPKEAPAVPSRTVNVETPLYRAAISSVGGRIEAWDLIYRGVKPMIIAGEMGPRGLTIAREGMQEHPVRFLISPGSLTLSQASEQGELRLVGEDGYGLRVTEVLRFHADGYAVEHGIRVENLNTVPQTVEIGLSWAAPVEWPKGQDAKFQGQHPTRAVKLIAGGAQREELASVKPFRGTGEWIGIESEWYLNALIPKSKGFQLIEGKRKETRTGAETPMDLVEVGVRASITGLAPGAVWEGQVLTYSGPKEYARLRAVGFSLDKSIYFGGFPLPQHWGGLPMEWLAVPILWVMDFFYSHIGNYGIAIILLTVMTKVLFFPLTIKSMTSMKAMQALQPQMNAIRAKYKSDPQRLQQETMALYRTHRVNPLGGCLPMVVQIPIFYALYVALSVSVELQSAPFICVGRIFGFDIWICDLAAHDPTYVLPLLMGGSMFVQQKMTPVMGDPRQAKMMLFMPVIFTFMFLNLPSGLVLYWTVSNVLQIAQQKYIEHVSKKPEVGKLEKGPRVPKKA